MPLPVPGQLNTDSGDEVRDLSDMTVAELPDTSKEMEDAMKQGVQRAALATNKDDWKISDFAAETVASLQELYAALWIALKKSKSNEMVERLNMAITLTKKDLMNNAPLTADNPPDMDVVNIRLRNTKGFDDDLPWYESPRVDL